MSHPRGVDVVVSPVRQPDECGRLVQPGVIYVSGSNWVQLGSDPTLTRVGEKLQKGCNDAVIVCLPSGSLKNISVDGCWMQEMS